MNKRFTGGNNTYTYRVLHTSIGDALMYSSLQSPTGASAIRLLSSTHYNTYAVITYTAVNLHTMMLANRFLSLLAAVLPMEFGIPSPLYNN